MHSVDLKAEAVRLRVEGRLSFPEILETVKVSKSTLSLWLRDCPLTESEKSVRRVKRGQVFASQRAKQIVVERSTTESSLSQIVKSSKLTSRQIGDLAEAAILLRLVARGFSVSRTVFEGSSSDWVVRKGEGPFLKLQVKVAQQGKYGAPIVPLTHAHSRKLRIRYTKHDWDFIVGFDLFSDTAYIWSWDETSHLASAVSLSPNARECWDKLDRG